MASLPIPHPAAWRIAIAGGGPPGLTLALALARRLGPAVAVTIHDPAFARPPTDGRAYALSGRSVALLTECGVLPGPALAPIRAMRITDSRLGDAVRPTYLTFAEPGGAPLGRMIEGGDLVRALVAACRAEGVTLAPGRIATAEPGAASIRLLDAEGASSRAALLVAADGARSLLREAAGLGFVGRRYGQVGLVATVAHEEPHGDVAVQHFLPAGPFALLPLPDGPDGPRSSLVWTEREGEARAVLALPPAAQEAAIAARAGPEYGAVRLLTRLSAHPLAMGLARDWAAPRLALLGDAAHAIHPLAGQGLNLALADADALARRIAGQVGLGLDPGARDVLAAYARDRRAEAVAMAGLTDGLNRLFSNDALPARVLRDLGLGLVDRMPTAKRALARAAAGAAAGAAERDV